MQCPTSAPCNNMIHTEDEEDAAGVCVASSSIISSKQPLVMLQGNGVNITKSNKFIISPGSAYAPVSVSAHITTASSSSSSTSLNLGSLSTLPQANNFTLRPDHCTTTTTAAAHAEVPVELSPRKEVNINLANNNINRNNSTAGTMIDGDNANSASENTCDTAHGGSGTSALLMGINSGDRISTSAGVRYRECLKNHAAIMGGYAVDGCGEFMWSGEEGSLEALKCAACGCHRNFHRREVNGESSAAAAVSRSMSLLALPGTAMNASSKNYGQQDNNNNYTNGTVSGISRGGPCPGGHYSGGHNIGPMLTHPHHHQYMHAWMHRDNKLVAGLEASAGQYAGGLPVHYGAGPVGGQRPYVGGFGAHAIATSGTAGKRCRTKFTMEQRQKMFEFSEKVGWRIHKEDEAAAQQFCAETGVKRHVLKVWMHNNKNTFGKKLVGFAKAFNELPTSST